MESKIRFTVCVGRITAACWTLWTAGMIAGVLMSLDVVHLRHAPLALMVFAAGNVLCAARRIYREREAFDAGFRIAEACQEAARPTLVR